MPKNDSEKGRINKLNYRDKSSKRSLQAPLTDLDRMTEVARRGLFKKHSKLLQAFAK